MTYYAVPKLIKIVYEQDPPDFVMPVFKDKERAKAYRERHEMDCKIYTFEEEE